MKTRHPLTKLNRYTHNPNPNPNPNPNTNPKIHKIVNNNNKY